ncbi:hypothetical protein GFC01_04560 [Desulfofundulus thermobenzoicus]|uniref:Copper amine oxidase-like N-terminal domain-containing protein n=1 Tax=Desulfofundulus thermobenzoicus TaxID=29376 RepID=A0A6N7IPP7_9FIRM|nr:copper amine oxidase N-terminal domain-containing protein [Desulfofundulus thermobenzoicus]MQL51547.1 hypothetical protein [Desulfofundulus thermobenzoicus]
MRKSRKLIAILATLALLATLLVPMVGPAAAASDYIVSNIPSLQAGQTYTSGLPTLTIDLKSLTVPGYVYLFLPKTPTGWSASVTATVPPTIGSSPNALAPSDVAVTTNTAGDEIYVNVTHVTGVGNDGRIILNFSRLVVPGGVSGDVNLEAYAPSDSPFSSGKITIARIGGGSVSLTVDEVNTITSGGGDVYINIKESAPGALKVATDSLKLTLPPGFRWSSPNLVNTYSGNVTIGGFDPSGNDGRDLKINVTGASNGTTGAYVKIKAHIDPDETVARYGDVEVSVSGGGGTSVSTGSLLVAKYGDFGVNVSTENVSTIKSGTTEERLDTKLVIEESAPGSLVTGRTITLTLPENVRWAGNLPTKDTDLTKDEGSISLSWSYIGSDGRTLKATVSGTSSGQKNGAKIVFKDFYVSTAPDFTGDLKVDVAGSAVTGTSLLLAKVEAPVNLTAASAPEVKIGLPGQEVGDITITEVAKEAIKANITYSSANSNGALTGTTTNVRARLELKAPSGVTFSNVPKVEVIEGDLQLDTSAVSTDTTSNNEGLLYIPVKSASTKPSTIKISGIKLTVDRTVPEGPLAIKVRGTAVNQTLGLSGTTVSNTSLTDTFFPGHKDVAKAIVANCVTPAPGEQKATVVFKISDTKYTVNGVEQTMDAAPYIKDGRTFVPVRYAAQAVGVTPENILYADGKVTLIKGDKVVQLTIGSNIMLINGVGIAMDVPAEIQDGRTMLPVSWLGKALDVKAIWDEATQSVTMTL